MYTEAPQESVVSEVLTWRRGRLVEAGFASPLAARLARNPDYDLHELVDLVERGCPPELAARILAPHSRDRCVS